MIELLDMAIQRWWQWMAPMSVQVCVLAVIVFLLDGALKRRVWPQLRAALWLVVLIKLIVPPAIQTPVSISRFELSPTILAHTADAMPLSTGMLSVLFALWLLGFVVGLVALLRRYRRLCADWLDDVVDYPPTWFEQIVAEAAASLSLRRSPHVAVAAGVSGPAVIGFFRPIVVIPAHLVVLAESTRLRHVLLHELAHVRRRDPLRHLMCLLLRLVYWFHPVVWIADARMRVLREICCDETVTRCLCGRTAEYRRTLLEMARTLLERPSVAPLAFVHHHSQLMARLEWLNRPISIRPPMRGIITWLACVVLVIACVPMGRQVAQDSSEFFLKRPGLTEGCLRMRYTVMGMLAKQSAETETINQG